MFQNYLTNVSLAKALTDWLEWLRQSGTAPEAEWIPVIESLGRCTAVAVYAEANVPHYHACAMDGIALRASLTFGATETTPVTLSPDQFFRIDTGDPLPEGCDAVIMIEDIVSAGSSVQLYQAALPYQHIRQIGEDFCVNDMLLPTGSILTPVAQGALLAAGVTQVMAWRQPVVGIIPTGDELVSPLSRPATGEILEFNSTIMAGSIRGWGALPKIYPIIPDRAELLESALATALQECDLVLINAGSSAGRDDRTAEIIGRLGSVFCHGIAIRPGKPTILGRAGQKPVVGIPGYPVSAMIVLEKVVKPLLVKLYGLNVPEPTSVTARLTRTLQSSLKYQEFVRVRLARIQDEWTATPLDRGAGSVSSFLKADALLEIPLEYEGLTVGSRCPVMLLRSESEITNSLSVLGSHDPLLDELSDLMRRQFGPAFGISSSHQGSMAGLMAIKRKDAHLAGIHLLDEASGSYNIPYLEQNFPEGGAILVQGVRRSQGLLIPPGNPKQIKGIADIAQKKLAYVNRQKGSGTRLLLDYLLKNSGLAGSSLSGYNREEYTHSAVAVLIQSGSADAGLGIYSAARLFGLDFVPLADESYDFLISSAAWHNPAVQRFLTLLSSDAFAVRIKEMGGYTLDKPGSILWGELPGGKQ